MPQMNVPYDLQRAPGSSPHNVAPDSHSGGEEVESVGYGSSHNGSESYLRAASGGDHAEDGGSLGTAQMLNGMHDHGNPAHHGVHHGHHHHPEDHDATRIVHEMHLALLYLLSNPEEFSRAIASRPIRGATTLHEWNAEYEDNESLAAETTTESLLSLEQRHNSGTSATSSTPLPFVVFADDAEVVLPAAHTASQLFGLEKITGMELEAAAGLPALSQLFLRWLALMPGGDHLNLIDPPGLTVMRIAGGRYRVTAAHRVVWTWMNEFPDLLFDDHNSNSDLYAAYSDDGHNNSNYGMESPMSQSLPNKMREQPLRLGDLVTLTIVDVFETDNQGKLLSYCPTFDNRAVTRTNATSETLRKSTAHLLKLFGKAQKSALARKISYHATQIAVALKERVVDQAVAANKLIGHGSPAATTIANHQFHTISENNHQSPVRTPTRSSATSTASHTKGYETPKSHSHYVADDAEMHEV